MKSEHQLSLASWALLKDIKTRQSLAADSSLYVFKDSPDKNTQMELLHQLEGLGVFKIEYTEQEPASSLTVGKSELRLRVNQIRFDEVYKELEALYDGREADYQNILVVLRKEPEGLSLIADGKTVWTKRFYEGSKIELLVEYLVNTKSGRDVSRAELQKIQGLSILSDIADELRKSGLKPLKDYFGETWRKQDIKIMPEVTMTAAELEKLLSELEIAENRKSSQK